MSGLAPHLSWEEVLRHSGWASLVDVPIHLTRAMERTAAEVWMPIREAWGGPLTVVSGLRNPAANKAAGGKRASQHMLGTALDLRPADRADVQRLYDLVADLQATGEIPRGGLAAYRHGTPQEPGAWRFLHADMRGVRARWDRKVAGRWTSFSLRGLADA